MGKKRVVKKLVKKPCPKKGGVVASRAAKKPLALTRSKEKRAVPIGGCRRPAPPRLDKLGSSKRKRDADKALRRKRESRPIGVAEGPRGEVVHLGEPFDTRNDDEVAWSLGYRDANDMVDQLNVVPFDQRVNPLYDPPVGSGDDDY